ncbi:hypothetical protein GQ457_18G009400 [Hibiscus cannabinus]
MVPNRLMLQGLEQKPNESLRQYAQRWRDVAAQVQPPIQENEITLMFIDTLKGVLHDRLIGHPTVSFADIVLTGERIEDALIFETNRGPLTFSSHYFKIKFKAYRNIIVSQEASIKFHNERFDKGGQRIETSTHRDKNMVEDSTDWGRKQETNLNGTSLSIIQDQSLIRHEVLYRKNSQQPEHEEELTVQEEPIVVKSKGRVPSAEAPDRETS